MKPPVEAPTLADLACRLELDPAALARPPVDSPGAAWLGPIASEGTATFQLVRPAELLPPAIEDLLVAASGDAA